MHPTRFVPVRLFAALLLPALLGGCGGGGSSAPVNTGPVTSAPRTANGLQFTLTADKSVYKVGKGVNFTLTVKNVGTQNVELSLPYPSTIVTITQGTQMVWKTPSPLNGGQVTGQGASAEVLQPGDSQVLNTAWSQTILASGKQVAPGQYTVSAQINDFAQAFPLSNSIQITITP